MNTYSAIRSRGKGKSLSLMAIIFLILFSAQAFGADRTVLCEIFGRSG